LGGNTSNTTSGFEYTGGLNLGASNQQQIQLQPYQNLLLSQQSNQKPLVQQQLAALTNSPYGSAANKLRSSIQDLKEDIFKPVSPKAIFN
jgi:hypothetical protein